MSEDDDEMTVCPDCELRYQVIFANDYRASVMNDRPNQYCPRCGHEFDA